MADRTYPCPSCGQDTVLDDEEEFGICSACGCRLRNFVDYVVIFEEERPRRAAGERRSGGGGGGIVSTSEDLVESMVETFVKAVKFWK